MRTSLASAYSVDYPTIKGLVNDSPKGGFSLKPEHAVRLFNCYIDGSIDAADAKAMCFLILDCEAIERFPPSDPNRNLVRMVLFFADPDPAFPVDREHAVALRDWLLAGGDKK